MKKLLVAMLSLVLMGSVFADDFARVRSNIGGPENNKYFLCVNGGCSSIYAGNRGKTFPMNSGPINNIITANVTNHKFNVQSIPASCNIEVKNGQTLVVSGTLMHNNNRTVINNLRCSIS